jgi:glycosyltransferase involved in cell wall biosynthesis
VKRLRDGTSRTTGLVNIAGYFQAPTGMGESARSTRATLDAGGVPCAALALPHPQVEGFGIPSSPEFFGWASYGAAASILVANADAIETALPFLPPSFAGTTRIGYWAWETEELPAAQARNARHFDEIWTPSGYSASAIRTHVHQPVRVVPHTIDFARLHKARARRPDLGLPEEGTLYGFMFDPMSGLERKNVRGLVAAFNQAFRPDDDAYLVLKVNSRGRRNYEFETLLASLSNDRILLVEDSFDRDETFDFLKSLDVYVSLHRSEAFGLTCAEAMALGKAVIASDYSGNLEYMDDRNSLLVPTSRVETSRAHGPYVAGTVWGEPDVAAAAAAMRRTLDAGLRGELGEIAARSVRERLDAKRLCALALESLEGVAARDEAAASAAGTH